MRAHRCTVCLTNWPPTAPYTTCPECDEPTRPSWQEEPIPVEEANFRRGRVEFESRYGPMEVS